MPENNSGFYDESAGAFVCDFISRLPTTDTGRNFELYPWQTQAIMEFYGSMERDDETGEALRKYWYLYLEIPKKNGKSELAAALGIYHLFADGELNAEVRQGQRRHRVWRRRVYADHRALDGQDDRQGRAEYHRLPQAHRIPAAGADRQRRVQVDRGWRHGGALQRRAAQARIQAQLRDLR